MRITVTQSTKLSELVRRIASSGDENIEVVVEDATFIKRHRNNIQFVQKVSRKLGKKVKVVTDQSELAAVEQPEPTPVIEAEDSKPPVVESTQEIEKPPPQVPEKSEVATKPPAPEAQAEKRAKPRRFSLSPKAVLITFFIILILGGIAGAFYVYFYLPRGTVTLFVGERVLERSLIVGVNSELESANLEERLIPGKEIIAEVEETMTFDSTGSDTVGDKAIGTMEVRNFTASDVQLPSGTTFTWQNTGGEDLQFVSLATVVVPEATETSPDANTRVSEASIVEVQIQAVDIGPQYNLPADSTFLVEGYTARNVRSDFFAVAATPFAGGTTRDVKIVTTEDQSVAQEQLKSQLFTNASEALKLKVEDGYDFDEPSINSSTKYVQFSEDAGAEADSFDVTLKVQSSVMTYDKSTLRSILQEDVAANIPDGFEMSEENVVVNIEEVSIVEGVLTLKSKISALVVPVLDNNQIRDDLISKRPEEAENYLREIDEIEGYDVRLWPALPDSIRRFPHIKERLEVLVEVSTVE